MWQVAATDWLKLLQLQNPGWWIMAATAVVLTILIWIIVRLVTGATEDVDPAEADREMLDAVNELRAQGDLSEDEFRSIKGRLVTRLGRSFQVRPRHRVAAKNADPAVMSDRTIAVLDETSEQATGTAADESATAQSNETESFNSPTNVPESTQDTADLSQTDCSSVSEETADNPRRDELQERVDHRDENTAT